MTVPRPAASGAASSKTLASRRRRYMLRRRVYAGLPPPPALSEANGAAPGANVMSPIFLQQMEQARAALKKLEAERDELREAALRARGDLENQRRRHQREKEELRQFGSEELLRTLLPALDHFALALQSLQTANDFDSVREGVTMIHREIMMILEQNGLEEIAPLHQPFDPNVHEAVATETNADHPDGVVLGVMRAGWSLRGKVLRPAMVRVNKRDTAAS